MWRRIGGGSGHGCEVEQGVCREAERLPGDLAEVSQPYRAGKIARRADDDRRGGDRAAQPAHTRRATQHVASAKHAGSGQYETRDAAGDCSVVRVSARGWHGQTIGIYEMAVEDPQTGQLADAGYLPQDVANTIKGFGGGLKVPKIIDVPVDGVQNSGVNDGETLLDITVAGAIAQAATIAVYFTGSAPQNIDSCAPADDSPGSGRSGADRDLDQLRVGAG